MPAGKNLKQLEAQHCRKPRHVSSARLPTPGQPSEWVLLRRIYFLNSERSKYVGLGLYPDRVYRAFFELGGGRQMPLVLHLSVVPTLALHLSKLCEHLTRGERYNCIEMTFRKQTVADTQAKMAVDRRSITVRLHEIEYLQRNFPMLANQLAESEVSEY